jgi:hypothetical protein
LGDPCLVVNITLAGVREVALGPRTLEVGLAVGEALLNILAREHRINEYNRIE